MDPHPHPTAEDLGVTEIEYERIMRGLGRSTEQAVPALPSAPTRLRPVRWGRLAVAVVLLLLALGARHGTGSGSGDGPGYAFLESGAGTPLRHSSCKPLMVAIYPAGGPADAEQLVREAVAVLRPATGLDIRVAGVYGGHLAGWNFESAPILDDDPVGVSWQDEKAIADLSDETVGLGGSASQTSPAGTEYLVAGSIALSRDYFATHGHADKLAVVLHEFGHVLGLDHVGARGEIMYPTTGATELGAGDREGLRRAGQGPCV